MKEVKEPLIGWEDIAEDEDIEWVRTVKAWTPTKAPERESCENWYDISSDEMTLEQARQAVRELRKYVMDNHILCKSEDIISRQAVLDLAKKGVLISNRNYKSVCKAINALPPVTPQLKTGHWILKKVRQEKSLVCSECRSDLGSICPTKYCPECGCRMLRVVEAESEET